MTRQELLRIVIRQARANGFPFRKWFQTAIDPSWNSFDDAVELLARGDATMLSFSLMNLPEPSGSRVLKSALSFPQPAIRDETRRAGS